MFPGQRFTATHTHGCITLLANYSCTIKLTHLLPHFKRYLTECIRRFHHELDLVPNENVLRDVLGEGASD